MSDVEILFDDKTGDNAVLLLAAAESLGLEAHVVRTGTGTFIVPQEVADEAGLGEKKPEAKKSTTTKHRK